MPRVLLGGGAYQARSVIASAQRSVNLYAEPQPQTTGEGAPVAHYPTPGLRRLGTLPENGVRAIKQTTTGGIYAVAGSGVYLVDPTSWTGTLLGSITPLRPYPVSMQDNGLTLVIVDGMGGWTVDLASHAFAQITDTAFYGADRVDFLDTYLLFNKPGTPQFYSSDSLSVTFDPLWFANKESFSDLLVTLAVAKREIWLIGERTTEIWANVGAADFPFQQVQSVFVDHGCRAKYSVATYENTVYWLGGDRAGQGVVLAGFGYAGKRISTYAIEAEWTTYPRIDDAVGFMYALGGHVYYVLTFPHADRTWVCDTTTGEWHEWLWIDDDGVEHRHRAACAYAVNGMVVAGDHANGNLYAVESTAYTDDGQPIKRVRSYPHLLNDANRVFYRQFVADIESGNPAGDAQGGTDTLLTCSFTAPDGTPIESYSNAADTQAHWTLVGGGGATIQDDEMTGETGTSALYASPAITPADYVVQFRVIPSGYDAVPVGDLYAMARSTGPGTGYRAMVAGDGTEYRLTLGVEGGSSTTLAMGTLSSGYYTVTLKLAGTAISLSVQRSQDSRWLAPSGVWGLATQAALSMTDGTYTAPGKVLIGGDW